MKFSIQINQLGVVEAGLADSTDLIDWALLEYVFDWQANTRAARLEDHVWLNYAHLIDEMPMLGLRLKSAISNRVKKLVGLGLLTVRRAEDRRLFARTTDFYLDVVKFRPGDSVGIPPSGVHIHEQGVHIHEQGVHIHEQGVHMYEHILNNQVLNNQNKLPGTHAFPDTEAESELSAVSVCALWFGMGMMHVRHNHPDLIELIQSGATRAEFEYAGTKSLSEGKGFGYALGIVRGRLRELQTRAAEQGATVTQLRQPWAMVPRDDEALWPWAKQHGYPGPGSRSYRDYRQYLHGKVEERLKREGKRG
ncbi:hypothetical protein ACQE3E_06570 [Methylomonas sp. MED-D]|uniref:hypothetical protein n=1 Tax=Methylomonas sp. MED-D TaxID=3418768 RepID=UPI003D069812